MSAELDAMNALAAGQRAGQLGLNAGLNPHQLGTPAYAEWERGRSSTEALRIAAAWKERARTAPPACRRTGETCDCGGRGICRDVA